MKTCARDGCLRRFQPKSGRQRFCTPTCRYAARALIDAARYGRNHKVMRRIYRRLVESGGASCARCGNPIARDEPWDLGHVDGDDRLYAGPEHEACNRATSSRRARRFSRRW